MVTFDGLMCIEPHGGINSKNCNISNLNHALLLKTVTIVLYCRWKDVTVM
jgi:hypothetical protein